MLFWCFVEYLLTFQFSIGDASEIKEWIEYASEIMFQFSIGDAGALKGGGRCLNKADVSILYWRCLFSSSGLSASTWTLYLFQFSIGDACIAILSAAEGLG